jgi:hypothetical protein
LTVVVLSPAGGGAGGLAVTIDGRAAAACGHGCYRVDSSHGDRTNVVVDGFRALFDVPVSAPRAEARVRALQRLYRSARSVDYVEHLASGQGSAIDSRWRVEAPNRLAYVIPGGAQAIVIGGRRWDRETPTGRWIESSQTPALPQPSTQWTFATNAHLLAGDVLAFADPTIPAFFSIQLGHDGRPRVLHMTAAAHFMTDRYVTYDSGRALRPPR